MSVTIEEDEPESGNEQARHFRLDSEFRRAAMWGIGGCVLIALVACLLEAIVFRRGIARLIPVVLVNGLIVTWLLQYLLPRVRVDRQGISRRILWWWNLWPWDAFADGKIRLGLTLYQYEFPEHPWWRRKLNLELLEQVNADDIRNLIRRVWVPPPVKAIPETLTVRVNWPDGRVLHLTAERLIISRKGRESVYRWNDVRAVEIWRTEPGRRDFRELLLRLTDQDLMLRQWLHQGSECSNWNGAAEEISSMFLQNVEPDRLRDFSLHGSPRSLEELDARELRDEAELRQLSPMVWCVRLMWATVAALPLIIPWPKWLIMAACYAPLAFAINWMCRIQVAKIAHRRSEYQAQRAELMKDAPSTPAR